MRWTVTNFLESLRRFIFLLIAAVAILEWTVVINRVWAAVWAWYKFVGYGGGGHVVVGRNTQMVFYILSTALASLGYLLSKAELGGASKVWKGVAQFGWLAILVCAIFWGVFLLTPLVTFQPSS
jgi:hypothetical protein